MRCDGPWPVGWKSKIRLDTGRRGRYEESTRERVREKGWNERERGGWDRGRRRERDWEKGWVCVCYINKYKEDRVESNEEN